MRDVMSALALRIALAVMLAGGVVAACDDDDAAEEIGEEIDDAVE